MSSPVGAKLSKRGHSRPPSVIPAHLVSFPRKRESSPNGSPIRSASLSVEDDGREWIPRLLSVIPAQTGIQSEWIPSQAKDDKDCVIPVKTGIQIQLDPQSEALRFRLRMTGGNGSRVSSLVIPVKTGIQSLYSGSRIKRGMPRIENKHFLTGIDKRIIA